jgi:hypothetical protein
VFDLKSLGEHYFNVCSLLFFYDQLYLGQSLFISQSNSKLSRLPCPGNQRVKKTLSLLQLKFFMYNMMNSLINIDEHYLVLLVNFNKICFFYILDTNVI